MLSPSKISDMQQEQFEPGEKLSSGFVKKMLRSNENHYTIARRYRPWFWL